MLYLLNEIVLNNNKNINKKIDKVTIITINLVTSTAV